MAKNKKSRSEKQEVLIITFNYADKLTNVFTGQEEDYLPTTRNNVMEFSNYIVKAVSKEYHTIEYDFYAHGYLRSDPEPKVTLYDYLYWKYRWVRDVMEDEYRDVIWTCPDTKETYSLKDIRWAFRKTFEALNNIITIGSKNA